MTQTLDKRPAGRSHSTVPPAIVLLLAPLLLLGPVVALEAPPACDSEARPCELSPGTTAGTLTRGTNDADHYRLSPPTQGSIIELRLEVTERVGEGALHAELVDPHGVVRAREVGTQALALTTVGAPSGQWQLQVAFHDPVLLRLPPWGTGPVVPNPEGNRQAAVGYTIELAYAPVDHVAPLEVPGGPAPTVTARFQDHRAHLDLYYETTSSFPGNNSWGAISGLRVDGRTADGEPIAATGISAALWSRVPFTKTEVWTQGVVPASLGDDVRVYPPALQSQAIPYARVTVQTSPELQRYVNVSIGLAWSEGLQGGHGWIAWDDTDGHPAPEVTFPQGGMARFAGLTGFHGEGPGARVGPISAAWDLQARFELPEDQVAAVMVRAKNLANHPPHPRATVELPNGSSVALDGDDGWWAVGSAIPGPWTVRFHERFGAEYGQMRLAAASFPLHPLT